MKRHPLAYRAALAGSQLHGLCPDRQSQAGMTLLEVLVACGVLMLGLTGIAGLLAATSSLLGEASNLDRVATLIANASAEIHNRQICKLETFQPGVGIPGVQTACLGELEQRIAAISSLVSSTTTTSAPLMPASTFVASRIDVPSAGRYRSFVSEDRLLYFSGTADLPVAKLTGTFAQESQQGTCWGGLLTLMDFLETPIPYTSGTVPHPETAAVSPNRFRGLPARLDIVIFKKPAGNANSGNAVLLLTATAGAFTLTGSSSDVQLAPGSSGPYLQKTFLPGCSYVLALPPPWSALSSALPQAPTAEGLAVLDRWDGQRVDAQSYPGGLKLAKKYVDTSRQRMFFLASAVSETPATLSLTKVVSLFSDSSLLSDGVGGRTKTGGAYTVRLLTRQDMQTVLRSTPAGWPTDRPYLSSTSNSTSGMWAYDLAAQTFQASKSDQEYYVALEVAVSPMWYRIQSSWCQSVRPNVVNVIFTDPRAMDFPRVRVQSGQNTQLRIGAFQGLIGVESSFLVVE